MYYISLNEWVLPLEYIFEDGDYFNILILTMGLFFVDGNWFDLIILVLIGL